LKFLVQGDQCCCFPKDINSIKSISDQNTNLKKFKKATILATAGKKGASMHPD